MRKTLATTDGIELHLRHWPFATRSRGTVLIVHGLGEHVARYGHVAAHLNGCLTKGVYCRYAPADPPPWEF